MGLYDTDHTNGSCAGFGCESNDKKYIYSYWGPCLPFLFPHFCLGWRYHGRKHSSQRNGMGTRDPFYDAQIEVLKLFEVRQHHSVSYLLISLFPIRRTFEMFERYHSIERLYV